MFNRRTLRGQIICVMIMITIIILVVQSALNWGFLLVLQYLYPDIFGDHPVDGGFSESDVPVHVINQIIDYADYGLVAATASIALISSCWVGWRLARNLSRPIAAVAQVARRIADGELSARVERTGQGFGEIAKLIADFNSMAARLERAETDLKYSNSAIAHELRTPLTILRGQLQGLADGVFIPDGEFYREMIESADDLARLIDDLRTLALLSAGKLELQTEPLDMAELVGGVVRRFDHILTDSRIEVSGSPYAIPVRADAAKIRQVILAILDNALRYGEGGPIRVDMEVSGDEAVFRCTDAGPGLLPGTEEKIFERFWRADNSRSRASGGSGLGLAIVRAIVRVHGGDAVARSRPGLGTTIEVRLPLMKSAVAAL